ncbi:nicotinamide riboside transporter PnuC [Ponticaulis sp.]|uniref:nicotinamide riboside transporter PnuC n=1 Tax=Ponticaulis sp. TaxID=2020902 RepID=UPI0025FFF0A1|nr:nicotinamide riboside transporter PnuC [Ponticaulis sp.]
MGAIYTWLIENWIELAGFVSGALCVWLLVKRNIWTFPVGMVNYVFFAILFIGSGLYADAGLQGVYFFLACLGWYWWLKGGDDHQGVEVHEASPLTLILCGVAVLIIAAAIQWLLHTYTNSTVAGLDALTTAMSLVAQFMLSRKWIANWWLWIAVDVIYIPLYIYKGLWLTAILYLVFLVMCVAGLIEWQKARTDKPARAAA